MIEGTVAYLSPLDAGLDPLLLRSCLLLWLEVSCGDAIRLRGLVIHVDIVPLISVQDLEQGRDDGQGMHIPVHYKHSPRTCCGVFSIRTLLLSPSVSSCK